MSHCLHLIPRALRTYIALCPALERGGKKFLREGQKWRRLGGKSPHNFVGDAEKEIGYVAKCSYEASQYIE